MYHRLTTIIIFPCPSSDKNNIGNNDAFVNIRKPQARQDATCGGNGGNDASVGEAGRTSDPIDPWCVASAAFVYVAFQLVLLPHVSMNFH